MSIANQRSDGPDNPRSVELAFAVDVLMSARIGSPARFPASGDAFGRAYAFLIRWKRPRRRDGVAMGQKGIFIRAARLAGERRSEAAQSLRRGGSDEARPKSRLPHLELATTRCRMCLHICAKECLVCIPPHPQVMAESGPVLDYPPMSGPFSLHATVLSIIARAAT